MIKSRIAAIDIGSNTVHMIVAERTPGGRLIHRLDRSKLLKLGLIQIRAGNLPDFVIGSIRRTLELFVREARDAGASEILIGATAAVRDDSRRQTIASRLGQAVGIPVRIISKAREIQLGFLAARHQLRSQGRQIFIDSGGASTEVTLCQGQRPMQTVSLPVGASRLSLLLEGDPPSLLSFARMMGPIRDALPKAPPTRDVQAALFSGGSAHHIGDVAGSKRRLLSRAEIDLALRHLLRKRAKKVGRKYQVDPRRIPILISGALILGTILEHYGLDRATVTANSVREGMIRAYLSNPAGWWKD